MDKCNSSVSCNLEGEDNVSSDKRFKVTITEGDLLCVNGCGFYGTPQCKGRCSKCWRAYQIAQKKTEDFAKNRELLSFDKFEERRKLSSESRSLTLKSILRRSSTSTDTIPSDYYHSNQHTDNSSRRTRSLSLESRTARVDFYNYLHENLPSSLVFDVTRSTRHAITKIVEQRNLSMEDLSALLSQFYLFMPQKLQSNQYFRDGNVTITIKELMAEIEKYICTSCYWSLFCAVADEEVADISLQERIRSFNWVTSGFLETALDFSQSYVQEKLEEAITEMIDINSHRGAGDKLQCLVRCSKLIFEALKESRLGAPASADEYLPVLIYLILKANPPLIQSNIKFISRFALPSRIMSGESGYYFTNLCCAVQFIQDMNADSLKMPREEFEAYTCGEKRPPLNTLSWGCNQRVRSMENILNAIRDLKDRQNELAARMDGFDQQIHRESEMLMEEIQESCNQYPTSELQSLIAEIGNEGLQIPNSSSSVSFTQRNSRSSVDDEFSSSADDNVGASNSVVSTMENLSLSAADKVTDDWLLRGREINE